MVVLHAVWSDGTLHLWGEGQIDLPSVADSARAIQPAFTLNHNREGQSDENSSAVRTESSGVSSLAASPGVSHTSIRVSAGELFDSLLVSGATESELTLRLPHRKGQWVLSGAGGSGPSHDDTDVPLKLSPVRVATLVFTPSDAIDLLTGAMTQTDEAVRRGASLHYWSRAASLVLELLAAQRFVPAMHYGGRDRYRGFWRVVVDDERTSKRLGALIQAMPPVCRSMANQGAPIQASALVENFLWTSVDTLVRRCLEGDELAHAISERSEESSSRQIRWLQSLVRTNAEVSGTPEERALSFDAVNDWLSKLAAPEAGRACRTCFRLRAPTNAEQESAAGSDDAPWLLTIHVQDTQNPEVVLDAERLYSGPDDDPLILQRTFANAREQVKADLKQAKRHFPPLQACSMQSGAMECKLNLREAYTFLRDAAPILESEGFGVWVPKWWRIDRPRPRMWLDLNPIEGLTPVESGNMRLDSLVHYDWKLAIGEEELSLEEISELAKAKEPLLQLRGRWTEVQTSEMKTALRFLRGDRGGKMTVFEALRQCYVADDLETGVPLAGLRTSGWIERLLDAGQATQRIEELSPPVGFIGTLRPYQLRGLEWLTFLGQLGLGACLADDMGLGKTIQLIALWLKERESGKSPGPTLLVVPMSLVGNWSKEIERFGPSLKVMIHHGTERLSGQEFIDQVVKHDVVISTYGLIHRDLEHLAAVEWYRIALDEAQNIKNPAAKQAVAIRSVRAVHRLALTGTPVENRLSELWSIIDFLNAGYLGTASDFRRRFAVPIERHHDSDRAQRLRHLMRPFVLRRVKTDPEIKGDLPDKMEMKVYCNLTREQAALYEAIVTEMLGQIDRSGGIQRRGLILATLVRLKQICNHPAHFLSDGSSLPHRSGKCERLIEMLEEVLAEGDRALVFTQFREMAELLRGLIDNSFDSDVLLFHGGTTRKNRDAIVEQFQREETNSRILVLSLKAGGYGLNLTAANHVFHFDRWWNPAVEDQATDRVHRIGQDKSVQVHKFVCIGTLEERIDALLEKKRNLADRIVGSGEQWLTELSTDKLREVFELSREAVADE